VNSKCRFLHIIFTGLDKIGVIKNAYNHHFGISLFFNILNFAKKHLFYILDLQRFLNLQSLFLLLLLFYLTWNNRFVAIPDFLTSFLAEFFSTFHIYF